MTKETKQKIYKIAQAYGYDAQSRQCIEEMAELAKAINKYWRKQGNGQPTDKKTVLIISLSKLQMFKSCCGSWNIC